MAIGTETFPRYSFWRSRRYFPLIHATLLSAAASSMALAAPRSAQVLVLNKANGSPIVAAWLWRTESAAAGTAAISGDTLYLIEDRELLRALDARTGKARWEVKLAAPITNTPVVGEEQVVVFSEGHLWGYSLTNGRPLWDVKPPNDDGFWTLSDTERPAIGEGKVFVCNRKRVMAVNTSDGSIEWGYSDAIIREGQTPVLEGDRVYLRTTDAAKPWEYLSMAEGPFFGGNTELVAGARRGAPRLVQERPKAAVSSATISTDRRTLAIMAGPRPCRYQIPAPFTISGIVGETPTTICIQITEPARPVPPSPAPARSTPAQPEKERPEPARSEPARPEPTRPEIGADSAPAKK